MAESTLIDYNFGRSGNTSRTYINYEEFRAIDYVAGWNNVNTKERAEISAGEQPSDIVKGRGNYLRTCLEHKSLRNTATLRGNFFPYCFSSDSIEVIPSNQRYWPALPKFTIPTGVGNETVDLVGFQNYVCPKKSSAQWPTDYYVLEQTASNSAWPIRPSNGDGGQLDFSPPKPYFTRIRIKLTDFKWVLREKGTGNEYERNILEDESVSVTNPNRVNGELLCLTKIRGFINLINPDAINASTNSSGTYKWPHNFNQIHYRVTSDPYGGDDNTPTLTIFNSEAAGYTNLARSNYQNESSYYGAGIPFEVPVLEDQSYLIFDIYTDCCDRRDFQTSPSTQWWQMTWSFESCAFRRISDDGQTPTFHIEYNPFLIVEEQPLSYWPKSQKIVKWPINHGLGTTNINVELYKVNNSQTGAGIKVEADVSAVDTENVMITILSDEDIPAAYFKAFIIGGNKF